MAVVGDFLKEVEAVFGKFLFADAVDLAESGFGRGADAGELAERGIVEDDEGWDRAFFGLLPCGRRGGLRTGRGRRPPRTQSRRETCDAGDWLRP